jgi:hypothetical protein
MRPAHNNGYKALLLINYFLRIKVTLHSQALAVMPLDILEFK